MSAIAGFAHRVEGKGQSAREIAERWHLRDVGLWMFLGTLVMLFAAFSSALVVRKSSGDWIDITLPQVLWANTALLILSSVTLEWGRRAGLRAAQAARGSIIATCVLGAAFFAGQVEGWRQLAAAGVFLPTSPSASFFYVLTGVHAAHVAAALASVVYLLARTMRPSRAAEWPYLAGTVSTFWHFLTGIWLYLLLLLQLS
jgi:cytochrome c oxidase subunit 3